MTTNKPLSLPTSTQLTKDRTVSFGRVRHVGWSSCAEEAVAAAQLRKEVRYLELVESLNLRGWKADLLTLEVGARGLIANGTFRSFVKLGFPPREATTLCRLLSTVVARCSYAIYLAHNHNSDLVIGSL